MPTQKPPKLFITRLEPARFNDELYGKQIEFNREKKDIIFHSKFHEPGILHFSQVDKILIEFDPKRKLLWWSIATFLLGIGIFLFIIRVRLPPWKVNIWIKNQEKPVKIRAWLNDDEADYIHQFCKNYFPAEYKPKS